MRILHVASGRLYGGIERMLVTLAAAAGSSGLDFEFAVASTGRLGEELQECGALVHPLGNVRLSNPASVLRARRHLRTILQQRRYAAVICHAPWPHALFGGTVHAAGVPCLLWQHDAATGTPFLERASRRIGADLVICNSRWTARSASALQPGVPCQVIHCPVRLEPAGDRDRVDIRSALGAGDDDVVVLAASRLEPWKGHLDLIGALSRLDRRPWLLWIAGGAQRPHEREYERTIAAAVRQAGLDGRVRMLGERRDVRRLLAGADVLAQANRRPEPFGVIFAEALLGGVPVVTTDLGGVPEIVDRSCGRLVPPGDQAAFASALDELLSNPALRQALGRSGPAHAADRCAPSVVLPRLESALRTVCVRSAA